MSITGPLVDSFGRVHTDLRISVTDRCNIRCRYCMPASGVEFRPHDAMARFEHIERFVRVAAQLGVHEVRLTGGEPLARKRICDLVEMLSAIDGIDDLAMTTNAILLPPLAKELKAAGLDRLNISLDTLNREKFEYITRRDELPRVLEGITAALDAGFQRTKINSLAIRGQTEEDVVSLVQFAQEHDLELRFIEFMPLDGDDAWQAGRVLPGEEILRILADAIGPLEPASETPSNAPATRYRFVDRDGPAIGVVASVSQPFCTECGRLRLTSDGKIRNCLFATEEWDTRPLMESNASDEALAELIRQSVHAKQREHGGESGSFAKPDRSMHQIGG